MKSNYLNSRKVLLYFSLIAGFFFFGYGLTVYAQDIKTGGLTEFPHYELGTNLLANSGFEQIDPLTGKPSAWSLGDTSAQVFFSDSSLVYAGNNSLRLENADVVSGTKKATQELLLKKGRYRISAWIKLGLELDTAVDRGVRITLTPKAKSLEYRGNTDIFEGVSDWQLRQAQNLLVTEDSSALLSIEAYHDPTGSAWFDEVELRQELPLALDVFLLYPNYRGILFDDLSQEIKFDVTVNLLKGALLSDYRVDATIIDETNNSPVVTKTYVLTNAKEDDVATGYLTSNLIAGFDGSLLINDRTYLAKFRLVKNSGTTIVYEYPAYRIVKLSGSLRSQMTMSFDESNNFLIRGNPAFILGVYDSAWCGGKTTVDWWETNFQSERRLFELPINFYLNYCMWNLAPDRAMVKMTALGNHGILDMTNGNCFQWNFNGDKFPILTDDAYLKTIAAHPQMGGYYLADECFSDLAERTLHEKSLRLRSLDPDNITFAALMRPKQLDYWRDVVDVLSTDPYPLYGAEPSTLYPFYKVAEWTKATKEAVKSSRPFMTVLQYFQSTGKGHWPTRDELRNMSYMAIAEGANGLFYWSLGSNALAWVCTGWCDEKNDYFDRLKDVLWELKGLESALTAPEHPELLTGNSNPNIHTRVKFINGVGYIISYNYTNQSATATFSWRQTPTTVSVYNEARSLALAGNSFTDDFAPYQAHVYVVSTINDTAAPTAPLNLAASVVSSYKIALSWSHSTDNIGVLGYTLMRNGSPVATISSAVNSYVDEGLLPSTKYIYSLIANDAAGNPSAMSVPVSATTLAEDTTPPVISNIVVSGITDGAARIGWTTNEPASSQIEYDSDISDGVYNKQSPNYSSALATSHSIGIRMLSALTTYHFRVKSGDANGNESISQDQTFTTTAEGTTVVDTTDTTDPSVSLSAPVNGATVSGTITVSATASDNVGVAGVQFKLDGANLGAEDTTSPYAVSWDTKGVANGTHTLTAIARDGASNTAIASAVGVTVNNPLSDTSAPTVPAGLSATAISTSQINLSWNASTDNVGVSGYRIYRNGIQIATTNTTSYANTNLMASTTYTYTLSAYDAAGNSSVQSPPANATTFTPADTAAPTVSITSPVNGSTVERRSSVLISASASDNIGVVKAEFYIDGVLLGIDTDSPYAYSWTVPNAKGKTYTLTAKAYDKAGNIGSSDGVNVSVAATKPSSPTGLSAVVVSSSQINLSWNASGDSEEVAGYKVYRDGQEIAACSSNSYTDAKLTPSTTYTYGVSAYDATGDSSDQSPALSVATKPVDVNTNDITPPPTPRVGDRGEFTMQKDFLSAFWRGNDRESGIEEYQYRIVMNKPNGRVLRDWTSVGKNTSVTATGLELKKGRTYYFAVKAKNGAGLWSEKGYSDGKTVDARSPKISHNSHRNVKKSKASIVFSARVLDTVSGVKIVRVVFSNGVQPLVMEQVSKNYYKATLDSEVPAKTTYYIIAKDNADNVSRVGPYRIKEK